MILDGKHLSSIIRNELRAEVLKLYQKGVAPRLAIINVGDDQASKVYIRNKVNACIQIGVESEVHELGFVSEEELLCVVDKLNKDEDIHGVLVQLPLPDGIDVDKVKAAIDPRKDVDCFNPLNVGLFYSGKPYMEPCTPAGIMEILNRYSIEVQGAKAVVIGRSEIVGKPIANLLTKANATVTICHSKTDKETLVSELKSADIIVSAVGKAHFIKPSMLGNPHTIIDVGINRDDEGKLCGDVDPECIDKCHHWTPVPGGVGPMTVTILLKNCIKVAKEVK